MEDEDYLSLDPTPCRPLVAILRGLTVMLKVVITEHAFFNVSYTTAVTRVFIVFFLFLSRVRWRHDQPPRRRLPRALEAR